MRGLGYAGANQRNAHGAAREDPIGARVGRGGRPLAVLKDDYTDLGKTYLLPSEPARHFPTNLISAIVGNGSLLAGYWLPKKAEAMLIDNQVPKRSKYFLRVPPYIVMAVIHLLVHRVNPYYPHIIPIAGEPDGGWMITVLYILNALYLQLRIGIPNQIRDVIILSLFRCKNLLPIPNEALLRCNRHILVYPQAVRRVVEEGFRKLVKIDRNLDEIVKSVSNHFMDLKKTYDIIAMNLYQIKIVYWEAIDQGVLHRHNQGQLQIFRDVLNRTKLDFNAGKSYETLLEGDPFQHLFDDVFSVVSPGSIVLAAATRLGINVANVRIHQITEGGVGYGCILMENQYMICSAIFKHGKLLTAIRMGRNLQDFADVVERLRQASMLVPRPPHLNDRRAENYFGVRANVPANDFDRALRNRVVLDARNRANRAARMIGQIPNILQLPILQPNPGNIEPENGILQQLDLDIDNQNEAQQLVDALHANHLQAQFEQNLPFNQDIGILFENENVALRFAQRTFEEQPMRLACVGAADLLTTRQADDLATTSNNDQWASSLRALTNMMNLPCISNIQQYNIVLLNLLMWEQGNNGGQGNIPPEDLVAPILADPGVMFHNVNIGNLVRRTDVQGRRMFTYILPVQIVQSQQACTEEVGRNCSSLYFRWLRALDLMEGDMVPDHNPPGPQEEPILIEDLFPLALINRLEEILAQIVRISSTVGSRFGRDLMKISCSLYAIFGTPGAALNFQGCQCVGGVFTYLFNMMLMLFLTMPTETMGYIAVGGLLSCTFRMAEAINEQCVELEQVDREIQTQALHHPVENEVVLVFGDLLFMSNLFRMVTHGHEEMIGALIQQRTETSILVGAQRRDPLPQEVLPQRRQLLVNYNRNGRMNRMHNVLSSVAAKLLN